MGAARVYGLDFIVPDPSTRFTGPQLIDLNGARASCAGAGELYGDHRVQAAVLRHIAGAAGRICALSQSAAHPDQFLFDADSVRDRLGTDAGLYSGNDCFVPLGDPLSHDSDAYVAWVAGQIGLPYEHLDLRWDAQDGAFMLLHPDGAREPFAGWQPRAPLWPYSLDQRNLPLPDDGVTNPLPLALAASNKLLTYTLLARRLPQTVPAFRPAGLWDAAAGGAAQCAAAFADSELLVLKPACSLRGFGTVVLPREALPMLAADLGLAGSADALASAAHLLAPALLWGDVAELLAVAQAYVRSAPAFHPDTDQPHACIHRATVLASDDAPPACIDVHVMLGPEPLTGPQTRESLVVSAASARRLLPARTPDHAAVTAAAQAVVQAFEDEARAFFAGCDAHAMLAREAEFLAGEIERHSDLAFMEVWDTLRGAVTLRELMEAPRTTSR